MVEHVPDLHSLVYGTPWIDPRTLLAAIENELRIPAPDFRTRLLLRDTMTALAQRWGTEEFKASLSPDLHHAADKILSEDLGRPGFTSLERRMADATSPETIAEFLRALAGEIHKPARLEIRGSAALILSGLLQRPTDDLDAVNEVPASIRMEHELLEKLTLRFGLRLAHFQSHYLPVGWEHRLRSFGQFGNINVFLVDPIDIFVGKLFSKRDKDQDDLRMLKRSLDRGAIESRLQSSAGFFLNDPAIRALGEKTWYILFGEALPA